jgi:uncharacterized protein Usg
MSSGDHPPTTQQVEVYNLTTQKLASTIAAHKKLMSTKEWKAIDGNP